MWIAIETFFLIYFVFYHGMSLLLHILSFYQLEKQPLSPPIKNRVAPSVNILIPAYNEENNIVDCILSALNVDYPQFHVTIIDDGSSDGTIEKLKQTFNLTLTTLASPSITKLETAEILSVYSSKTIPHLNVLSKKNGGKADALNAGVNLLDTELVCCIDADTLIEKQSLWHLVHAYLINPEENIAIGGSVRIGNSGIIRDGTLIQSHLPRNILACTQVLEYLKAFLIGRVGWSQMNSLLIISGAFGLFNKKVLVEAGGYQPHLMGEDMELILRLHKKFKKNKAKYRILHVPASICWTEAPQAFSQLQKQRIRWQRGILESLTRNWHLCFSGGIVGWIGYPFFFIFEGLDPLIEAFGYIFLIMELIYGHVAWDRMGGFLYCTLAVGLFMTLLSLLVEEVYFKTYHRWRHIIFLSVVCFFELCFYRKIIFLWRLQGTLLWLFARKSDWGHLKRKGWETIS